MPHERLYSPGPTDIRKNRRLWIEPGEDQELLIGKGKRILLTLRHYIADNIYCLLHEKIIDEAFHDDDLNCHTAAAIALGECKDIHWGAATRRGKCMPVEEAITSLPLPCGMQIHDSAEFRQPLHSAVLLGPSADDIPLAFHKNGSTPMELCPISDFIAHYRKQYGDTTLTFYTPKPRVA